MAHNDAWDKPFAEDDSGATVQFRPPPQQEAEVDMTPMIDCVFLLLIFFLISSIPDVNTAVELAPARYGKGADPSTAVFVTIADSGGKSADIYLADGKIGSPLPKDPKAQEAAVLAAVRKGFQDGKSSVIIKAERSVKHKEVSRVATAASLVEGIQLYLAVFEKK